MHTRSWREPVLVFCIALLLSCAWTHARAAGEPTAASSAAREPSVWAADPYTKIDPSGKPLALIKLEDYRAKNAVWNLDAKTVKLCAARNEWVSFQLQIEAGAVALKDVRVKVGDLVSKKSRIPADNFRLYGEAYTQVTEPSQSPAQSCGRGWYPDALIPMTLPGYDKCSIPQGTTQGIWVDLFVPADAPSDEYTGTVSVSAANAATAVITVNVHVFDFAIPGESHLRWRVGYNETLAEKNNVPFDRRTGKVTQEWLDFELKFYRLCREHRITPTTHYTSPLPDTAGKGADLTIDWASYDRRFGRYLDGSAFDDGIPVNIFSLPVNPQSYDGWPSSTRYFNRIDLASFRKATELTVKHWDEMGWDLKNTFVYVADEPAPNRSATIKDHCRIIAEVDPRPHRTVALYTNFGANGPNVVAEFRSFINHWDIAGDYMNRKSLNNLQSRGDWIGIYQGSEPFQGGEALDGDGFSLVTWPWIAWMYRLDTLFIYNSTEWNTNDIWTQPRNHGWVTNSQGVLFYPGLKVGVKEALPCIRLKQMRMGMQDYEYMWMLKEAGHGDVADAAVKAIIKGALEESQAGGFGDKFFKAGRWERDPAKWVAARIEMARALEGLRPEGAKP